MKTVSYRMYLIGCVLLFTMCQIGVSKGNRGSKAAKPTIQVQDYELVSVIRLRSEPGARGVWRCSISAFDQDFQVLVEANTRLIAELPPPKRKKLLKSCRLYSGQIEGVEGSWVRLSKTRKEWSGMIWDGEELYIIDPLKVLKKSLVDPPPPRTSGMVIYKLSDVIEMRPTSCGVVSTEENAKGVFQYEPFIEDLQNLIPLEAAGASLNLDMAVVTDPLFSQIQEGTFGTPTAAAVAARINVVDGIYSEQVGVQISLVDVIELADNGPLTSTSAGTLLNQFSNFVGSSVDNPGITHLFTGRELNGGVIGIAFLGVLCDQNGGVGVDEIRGGGTSGALLVAHELGHNFGAPHDNQGGSPCASTPGDFIMNPFLNGSDQFSQCSIDQMQPEINNASCITVIDGNQPPTVTITSPEDAAFLPIDSETNFVATANDPEDGDLGNDIIWSSDIDGNLGTGSSIAVILSDGTHVITASVADSDGLNAADSITVAVVDQGGTVIIASDFDANEEGFTFIDDAFRGTSEPGFADGAHLPDGGLSGGALQVLLGNINDQDITGMSGGWEQAIVLDSDQEVTMTFRYNLTQASDYEADEFSQALLSVDGSLVTVDGNDFLAEITGNGNGGPDQTTGWVAIGVNLGTLSAGSHTITIGAFNNKKTFNNESTELRIDDVTIKGESGPPPPDPGIIIESHFDDDAEGFVFEDDPFRGTNNPDFASGSHVSDGGFSGGGLQVLLGDIDNEDILGISGGWSQSFTLDESRQMTVSFRFNLTQDSDYEPDEFSEVLVMVDDSLISPDTNGSLLRLTGDGNGGPDQTTGWVLVSLDLGVLSADAVHTLTIGGFNNKKTFNNELTELRIDDVIVSGMPAPLPTLIFENHFDTDEEDFTFEADAFQGTNEPDFVNGSFVANGGFTGGALEVVLGNIDDEDITGMSGGWSRSFSLDEPQQVTLSFRYNLTQASNYESDEFSEALAALDDSLIAPGAGDALARLTGDGNGGTDQTTGWILVNLDLGTLNGEHRVTIGGFNNKKTFNDEVTQILIDDVVLQGQ